MTHFRRAKVALLVCVLALVATPYAARATENIHGVYKLFKLGEPIGAERFTIRFESTGNYVAEGDISTKVDDVKSDTAVKLETDGEDRKIRSFQKELRINEMISVYTFREEKGAYEIASKEGVVQQSKKVHINPTATLIEPGVIHHLLPLLRAYDEKRGGEQRFPVYLGTEERETETSIAPGGLDAARLTYGTFAAHRLFLNLGDTGMYLWIGPKGELLRVEDPIRGHVAELLDYKGETTTEPPREPVDRRDDLLYEETAFVSDGTHLSAMLTRPKDKGRLPGLVFVSDDGPHDRDGTVPHIGVNIGTAEMMDAISAAGYVVLRYDDRGVAMSEGQFLSATLSVLEKDAEAALDFLKKQPEVDASRIAFVGHGAGANLALRIAARRNDVAAVVALAPSSVPLDELAMEQVQRRLEDEGRLNDDELRRHPLTYLFDQAKTTDRKWLVYSGKAMYLDVFREYATLNPPEDLAKVPVPVLLAWAGRDQQIFPEHGERLAEVCREIANGRCTPMEWRNLDHFFKESQGTYGEAIDPSRRVDADFIAKVAAWLDRNLKSNKGTDR